MDVRELCLRFSACAERIRTGKPGEDFSVVKDELYGYDGTAVEAELSASVQALAEALKADPSTLSAGVLEACVDGIASCAPGVDGYRARMLKAAGDYDDETSPVADAVEALLDALRSAARALAERGLYPLDAVPKDTWLKPVAKACGTTSVSLPFYDHLFLRGDALARRGSLAAVHAEALKRIEAIAAGLGASKKKATRQALSDLVSAAPYCYDDLRRRSLVVLAGLLGHPDASIAEYAASLLESNGDAGIEAVLPLVGASSPQTRRLAFSVLRRSLDDDPYIDNGLAARIVESLLAFLRATEEAAAIREAKEILLLCSPSDPETSSLFFDAVGSGQPTLAAAATDILYSYAQRGKSFPRACVAALGSSDEDARRIAKNLLRREAESLTEWLLFLTKSESAVLRRDYFEICDGLSRFPQPVFMAGIEALRDPDPGVRSAAAAFLARYGEKRSGDSDFAGAPERELAAAALTPIARDPSGLAAAQAANALFQLDYETEGGADLGACFAAADPQLRREAATLAGFLDEKAAPFVAGLRLLVHDPDAEVRANAAWAFCRIGVAGLAAVPDLLFALGDEEIAVRRQAAFSLRSLPPDDRVFPAFVAAAGNPKEDDSIRGDAFGALAQYPWRRALEALPAMLEAVVDEGVAAYVRLSILDSLGVLFEAQAAETSDGSAFPQKDAVIAALKKAAVSMEENVSKSAGELLKKTNDFIDPI